MYSCVPMYTGLFLAYSSLLPIHLLTISIFSATIAGLAGYIWMKCRRRPALATDPAVPIEETCRRCSRADLSRASSSQPLPLVSKWVPLRLMGIYSYDTFRLVYPGAATKECLVLPDLKRLYLFLILARVLCCTRVLQRNLFKLLFKAIVLVF